MRVLIFLFVLRNENFEKTKIIHLGVSGHFVFINLKIVSVEKSQNHSDFDKLKRKQVKLSFYLATWLPSSLALT